MTRGGPPSRPRRIALFLPNLEGGGAERVTLNLAAGLRAEGVEVELVVGSATGVFADSAREQGRVVDLNVESLRWSIGPLARYLRRSKPDGIIAAIYHANVAAVAAKLIARTGVPVVATVHTPLRLALQNEPAMLRWVKLRADYSAYRHADAVVAVSQSVADVVANEVPAIAGKLFVIHNPVVTDELLSVAAQSAGESHAADATSDAAPGATAVSAPGATAAPAPAVPVIMGAGRLAPEKDFATLIRAFAILRRTRSARLVILGEGDERSSLELLSRQAGVQDDVDLPGFKADALARIAAADVFALSSVREALPTVLIEALALGTPIVSTDCPVGPREILADGRYGLLVPVGDPEAMATALRQALDETRPTGDRPDLTRYTPRAAAHAYLRVIEGCREWAFRA